MKPAAIQRLERLVALCPACHQVKHPGFTFKHGRLATVVAHLAAVNRWSRENAELYLEAAFETWAAGSCHQWTLDISTLATRYGVADADG